MPTIPLPYYERARLAQLATECNADILLQSSTYFLQAHRPTLPGCPPRIALLDRLRDHLCAYRPQDYTSRALLGRTALALWQLPLGLLIALKLLRQSEQIERFFTIERALPLWYQNTFLNDFDTALVLRAERAASCLEHSAQLPWSIARTKALLRFRLQGEGLGFRCSISELLLFLNFAPLSLLFGLQQSAAHSARPNTQGATPLNIEAAPKLGELLAVLDFEIYELFGSREGGNIYLHDMLQHSYREGLKDFWNRQYAAL